MYLYRCNNILYIRGIDEEEEGEMKERGYTFDILVQLAFYKISDSPTDILSLTIILKPELDLL